MEHNSSNALPFRHISHATQEAINTIDERRNGNHSFLRTRWPKLNNAMMDGIEWNCIFTIGGISGSGKSAIADEMETSLFDLNPNEQFAVLSFNWEMVSSKRVIRKFSSKLGKSVKHILSSNNNKIDDHEMQEIGKAANQVWNYNIYYVDYPGTPADVYATFHAFKKWAKDELNITKFVIFLDHTILTKGATGGNQTGVLAELQNVFVTIKKEGAESKEFSSIIVQLSQLNRDIEKQDRIMSIEGHFPKRSDIFGGDSVYQASDYVMITHRPEILYLQTYGPQDWPVEGMIYWHLIKSREGESCILAMINNLKVNRVDEA
jgi:replicative DNA helicase